MCPIDVASMAISASLITIDQGRMAYVMYVVIVELAMFVLTSAGGLRYDITLCDNNHHVLVKIAITARLSSWCLPHSPCHPSTNQPGNKNNKSKNPNKINKYINQFSESTNQITE